MPEQVLYGIKLLAQASPRPMRAEPRWTWTNESGDDCDGGQVYLVAGGWVSGGSTDSTETLVEGDSAWTTHQPLWAGIGDARILTYNNIPFMFGGNLGPAVSGELHLQHSHWLRASQWAFSWFFMA